MRAELQHVAVLDRPGLALVGVDDDEARCGLARDRLPLDPGREAGAAVAREPGCLQLLDDAFRGRELAQQLEPAAGGVVGERVVALREPEYGTVVRRVRDLGDDLVAARQDRREIAVAEAGDLDRTGVLREQLARSEAVADGPGADAHRVDRHLEERVEGDDLVHLAAPDVHVVGERVRELRRDRADLAADAAEVVEQPRALSRQLGEQRRCAQHVHRAIVLRVRALVPSSREAGRRPARRRGRRPRRWLRRRRRERCRRLIVARRRALGGDRRDRRRGLGGEGAECELRGGEGDGLDRLQSVRRAVHRRREQPRARHGHDDPDRLSGRRRRRRDGVRRRRSSDVAGWRIEGEELVLLDADDGELLRFEAGTPVGSWEATGFLRGDAVTSPIAGSEITATFSEEGELPALPAATRTARRSRPTEARSRSRRRP